MGPTGPRGDDNPNGTGPTGEGQQGFVPNFYGPSRANMYYPLLNDFSGNQDGYYFNVSASSTDSTNYAYKAFDKTVETYWNSALGTYDVSSGAYIGGNNMNITGSFPIDQISTVNTTPFYDETSFYAGKTQNYTPTFTQSNKNIADDYKMMIYHTFDSYNVVDKVVLNKAQESTVSNSSNFLIMLFFSFLKSAINNNFLDITKFIYYILKIERFRLN